jgi:hypothetical protein
MRNLSIYYSNKKRFKECSWVLTPLLNKYSIKAQENLLLLFLLQIKFYFSSFVGFFVVVIKQTFIRTDKSIMESDVIILELEKEYRHQNINKILKPGECNLSYLNIFDKGKVMTRSKVDLIEFLIVTIKSISEFNYIYNNKALYASEKKTLISSAASLIISYAFYFCFFKKISISPPNVKVFSGGAMLVSHAVINNKIECNYIAHGALKKPSYLDAFPNFNKIYLYSNVEKNWLLESGIKSRINVYRHKKINIRSHLILIFLSLPEMTKSLNLELVISTFLHHSYSVVVKAHPLFSNNDYVDIPYLSDIEIIDNNYCADAQCAINKYKPSFTYGDTSTALIESLNMGIIPILSIFLKSREFDMERYFIYDFNRKSLNWHTDFDKIVKCIGSDKIYTKVLKSLLYQ